MAAVPTTRDATAGGGIEEKNHNHLFIMYFFDYALL